MNDSLDFDRHDRTILLAAKGMIDERIVMLIIMHNNGDEMNQSTRLRSLLLMAALLNASNAIEAVLIASAKGVPNLEPAA